MLREVVTASRCVRSHIAEPISDRTILQDRGVCCQIWQKRVKELLQRGRVFFSHSTTIYSVDKD